MPPRVLALPDPSLVVLVGAAGCGKSTFAHAHFRATEILSSDAFRAMVADDEGDQTASGAAFEVLHFVAARRLARRRLTVVDATNVQRDARRPLAALAAQYHLPLVAIVLDLPEELCLERDRRRVERQVGDEVIHRQLVQLDRSLRSLAHEGFHDVHVLDSADAVDQVMIARAPLPCDHRGDHGPFDIVGDVHGCGDELEALLAILGYAPDAAGVWRHPAGRRALFLGDLVDRGPRIAHVLELVMGMREAGTALCLPGNHDDKLLRRLRGRNVQVAHGLQATLDDLEPRPDEFRARVAHFLGVLPSHLVLDGGALVAAHAGMKESLQGRESRRVRDFALFGDATGTLDERGLPIRRDWAANYHGAAAVVYGHTPVPEPQWRNRTINIDTGCVFGGRLTALRYPELELVSVPARAVYAEPARAFLD
jgi:protein phosphatase